MGISVKELALLKMVLHQLPNASPSHLRAMLCIIGEKNSYLSLEEIERNTLIGGAKLRKILNSFTEKQLLQKEGCLYRKIESEQIAEIIECK